MATSGLPFMSYIVVLVTEMNVSLDCVPISLFLFNLSRSVLLNVTVTTVL